MYTRQNPSPRYSELVSMYRSMHSEGERFLGIPPENTFPGRNLLPHGGRIKHMIMRHGAKTLLDYGSGKGMQYQPIKLVVEGAGEWPSIQTFWGIDEIYCYDPAYEPFNKLPERKFDGVISTDVLEHCPEEDIPWILNEIFDYAIRFVYVNVACYPANKHLPNKENAHCTIREPGWWEKTISEVSGKYPHIEWLAVAEQHTKTGDAIKRIETLLGN